MTKESKSLVDLQPRRFCICVDKTFPQITAICSEELLTSITSELVDQLQTKYPLSRDRKGHDIVRCVLAPTYTRLFLDVEVPTFTIRKEFQVAVKETAGQTPKEDIDLLASAVRGTMVCSEEKNGISRMWLAPMPKKIWSAVLENPARRMSGLPVLPSAPERAQLILSAWKHLHPSGEVPWTSKWVENHILAEEGLANESGYVSEGVVKSRLGSQAYDPKLYDFYETPFKWQK